MKKKFYLYFSFLVVFLLNCIYCLSSCEEGKAINFKINIGDQRIIFTSEYLIIEECNFVNGLGHPSWEFKEVISKKDTLGCKKLFNKLK